MAVHRVEGWAIILPEFHYSEKYWSAISTELYESHGNGFIKSNDKEIVLKKVFKYFEDEFLRLISKQTKASFYLYVSSLHENSLEVWKMQLDGYKLSCSETDFVVSRRFLKIILEQSASLSLTASPSFINEIIANRVEYQIFLEELLYLGYQAFIVSDYIARLQLFPNSILVNIVNKELEISTQPIYDVIFKYVEQDMPKHNDKVEIINIIDELRDEWLKHFHFDFKKVGAIVNFQIKEIGYRASFIDYNKWVNDIVKEFSCDHQIIKCFLDGLTISAKNYLSFEDCILRSQDERRFMFRPILLYNIDGEYRCHIGMNKWSESFMMLSTNSLPFGSFPSEWTTLPLIKTYMLRLQNNHDKLLENPAVEIIKRNSLLYDRNVKSLKISKQQSISLIKKDIGELDLLIINEKLKKILVVECKFNRSRMEYFNWRRDYINFKGTYEKKLENKVQFISKHTNEVLRHFENLHSTNISEKENYEVEGVFLINAPTLYMYDSQFTTATLTTFEAIITGKYFQPKLLFEKDGKKITIDHPYFINAEKYF